VAATIVKSSDFIITKKTTVVMFLHHWQRKDHRQSSSQVSPLSLHQAKDVLGVTTMEEDAALQKILVAKVRVIVMVPETEEEMMEIEVVGEILYVEAIIARNLACTTMRKMIAVSSLPTSREEQESM